MYQPSDVLLLLQMQCLYYKYTTIWQVNISSEQLGIKSLHSSTGLDISLVRHEATVGSGVSVYCRHRTQRGRQQNILRNEPGFLQDCTYWSKCILDQSVSLQSVDSVPNLANHHFQLNSRSKKGLDPTKSPDWRNWGGFAYFTIYDNDKCRREVQLIGLQSVNDVGCNTHIIVLFEY